MQRRFWSNFSHSLLFSSCLMTLLGSWNAMATDNDLFSDRIVLTGTNITVAGDNSYATIENGEPLVCALGHSVWYSWTAPSDGAFYIEGNFNFDDNPFPVFSIYTGDSLDSLQLVPWLPSGKAFVKAGETLAIQIASRYDYYYNNCVGGGFHFSLRLDAALTSSPNDQFSNATVITQPDYHFAGALTDATIETNEPLPSASLNQSLWWTFTPTEDGILEAQATSLYFTPTLTFYEGTDISSLKEMSLLTTGLVSVHANHTYKLQLCASNAEVANFTLDTHFNSSKNDSFAQSLHIEGTNVTFYGNNWEATSEANEPVPTNGSGHTLWYSWVAPCDGPVRINGISNQTSIILTVFTGPSLDHLTTASTGKNQVRFLCQEGEVYYLQVDGNQGAIGAFALNLAIVPLENDNFNQAIELTGFGPVAIGSIIGATLESGEPSHLDGSPCKSVWYKWQATVNGNAAFYLTPDNGETNMQLALYTGSNVSNLTRIAVSGYIFRQDIVGGDTFYVAVVGSPDATEDFTLSIYNGNSRPLSISVPGNLLRDPSFEGTGLVQMAWNTTNTYGGYVGESGGADGTTWINFNPDSAMWQDVTTTPGYTYKVKFAYKAEFKTYAKVGARFGDEDLGVVECNDGSFWHWAEFTAHATNSVSRFTVEVLGGTVDLDAFSIVPDAAKPVISVQTQSTFSYAGGSAVLSVGIQGTYPISYQWYFNSSALPGQTNDTLSLVDISTNDSGSYFVIVTNAFGAVTSSIATLTVQTPERPEIVLQPAGDRVAVGGFYVLSVSAIGIEPLYYQWFLNDSPISDGTNRHLAFSPVQVTNAGTYTVRVSNAGETVWSLPAVLTVTEDSVGGGALLFANGTEGSNMLSSACVFDVDGYTKLFGSNYMAQLYVGATLDSIRAVGNPRPFLTGYSAGLISSTPVILPTVPPFTQVYAQVRAWESSKGATYEEARAMGGKFGKSEVFELTCGEMPTPPSLWNLKSFSLKAGLPLFTVGKLRCVEVQSDGSVLWELEGQTDSRYLIERSESTFEWHPFLILTNTLGTVSFKDSNTSNAPAFYRARILD